MLLTNTRPNEEKKPTMILKVYIEDTKYTTYEEQKRIAADRSATTN